jgi:hypothetical protein
MAGSISAGGASVSDILTAFKNLVTALNSAAQTYLSVNGSSVATAISTPTVVKASAGRLVNVSVVVQASAVGGIYDASALGVTTRPLYEIPSTIGVFDVNLPAAYGILVIPGAGMTVAVSYS